MIITLSHKHLAGTSELIKTSLEVIAIGFLLLYFSKKLVASSNLLVYSSPKLLIMSKLLILIS